VQAARQTIRSFQTTALYASKKWLRLSATNPPARTTPAMDRAPRFRDRVPRLERALLTDRAPGPELVPPAGRFRRPTNCATDKQYCGRCSSGSLAILAANRRTSSRVSSLPVARWPASSSWKNRSLPALVRKRHPEMPLAAAALHDVLPRAVSVEARPRMHGEARRWPRRQQRWRRPAWDRERTLSERRGRHQRSCLPDCFASWRQRLVADFRIGVLII
jgi:hypothetical protein